MSKIKKILKLLFCAIVFPIAFLLVVLSKITGFAQMSTLVGMIPLQLGELIRMLFYKMTLKSTGKNIRYVFGCNFAYPYISIGNNVLIGYGCIFGLCDIGDNVLIAADCSFTSGSRMHGTERVDIPMRFQQGEIKRIRVGSDVWVGTRAIVMADVSDGAVVGSGAVVTKAVEPYAVVAGNPAVKIKSRR